MLPILPPNAVVPSPLADSPRNFPPNLVANIPDETLKAMTRWLYHEYVLPQMMERQAFEPIWDLLYQMYRINLSTDKLRLPRTESRDSTADRILENTSKEGGNRSQVSDSLVYDAVDRLKNLNHFISWKDGTPIQFSLPKNFKSAKEDEFYHPLSDKIDSDNGLLDWNLSNQDVYRKHLILSGHHYLYGVCFVGSELEMVTQDIPRQKNDGSQEVRNEITKIGVSFNPISIRRLWLNYRVSAYDMDYQPCPFFMEELPRFAIMQNLYDPQKNPMGFLNLDRLGNGQWLLSTQEMESVRKALEARISQTGNTQGLTELLSPKHSVEGLWSFYPMMPFDPQTLEWEKRADGSAVPYQRFLWQSFASSLAAGEIIPLRIQRNFYPRDSVPIWGSAHMPDMDSGLYGLTIGELLSNHYKEICTAMNQYIDNKNLINNPPTWTQVGSPANAHEDPNKPGARITVNGPQDVGWRIVPDATQSTASIINLLRDQGQTTSKAVDAILGKALGGRTSATEASNVFQAAMSGVTTDINLFNYDIMGGYATRVWEYCGLWFDPDLLKAITGMYGPALQPEDLWTRVAIKTNVGSTYIESIVKQGNIRYALESAVNSQVLDQATLWRILFKEFRMPDALEAIRDQGFEQEVGIATEQAIETYLGRQVVVDPNQNHQIAVETKLRFLKDGDSKWNVDYGANPSPFPGLSTAQYLSQQIQLHQSFALLQMQQQAAQQQLQIQAEQKAAEQSKTGKAPDGKAAQTAGQLRQAQGN